MSEHKVGKINITLEETKDGVIASAIVRGTANYRHRKMYQGYTKKQILSRFAKEVKGLEI